MKIKKLISLRRLSSFIQATVPGAQSTVESLSAKKRPPDRSVPSQLYDELYDESETQPRLLETLRIVLEKDSAILFTLIDVYHVY